MTQCKLLPFFFLLMMSFFISARAVSDEASLDSRKSLICFETKENRRTLITINYNDEGRNQEVVAEINVVLRDIAYPEKMSKKLSLLMPSRIIINLFDYKGSEADMENMKKQIKAQLTGTLEGQVTDQISSDYFSALAGSSDSHSIEDSLMSGSHDLANKIASNIAEREVNRIANAFPALQF